MRIWREVLLSALLVTATVEAQSARLIYTRSEVELAAAGGASLRRTYNKPIELPWPFCEGGRFTCFEDVLYGQVYQVAFVEESVTRGANDEPVVERIDRGRLSIAVEFPVDVESMFEEALLEQIRSLTVSAYKRPRAGLGWLVEPMKPRTMKSSDRPAWICEESDGNHHFTVIAREMRPQADDSESAEQVVVLSRGNEEARTACRAIAAVVEEAPPESYRTMPEILEQTRREVRLAEASTLEGLTWSDRLAAIPEGASLGKRPLGDGQKTGGIRDRRDGAFIGHEGRYADIERVVRLPAASLEVLEAPMWVTRWAFATVRERFGAEPRIERDPVESVVVAVLPIRDPLMDELERSRRPLAVPDERLVERVSAHLEGTRRLGPDLVLQAFAAARVWPSSGDWMILSCHDDGSARYGIAPFAGAAEVRNPREACAAVRRELGE